MKIVRTFDAVIALLLLGVVEGLASPLGHLVKTSWPEMKVNLKNVLFKAKSSKERKTAMLTSLLIDPTMLRKIVHEIEGDYEFKSDGATLIPRSWDLFVRCSTELGHRGDYVPPLFDRWFSGSALNAQPKKYGACPWGFWEKHKIEEPHLMMKGLYPSQVQEMEEMIDGAMEKYLGKRMEIGEAVRLIYWDLFMITSYGVGPSEETAQMLQYFEDHSPEFDYAVRMSSAAMEYEWPASLAKQVKEMGDFCWKITLERKANLKDYADKNDVLTNMLREYPDMDTATMEGAMRGCFTGGMNNGHSALCGALIHNAKNDDEVYKYYMKDPTTNIEHITREALRLYTSIPTSRKVREEDDFVLDGKKLKAGTSVLLSTYAINTDPRSHKDPLEFKPDRFQKDMDSLGYMCSPGFAPLGVAAELGGRPCGARFHDVHMLNVAIGKLLRDYSFTNPSGKWDFKQNSGTSQYAGKCYATIEKR